MRALGSSDRSPHRHIDIELRGLRLSHRQVGDLTVRLVEHGGQPGLLFWQNTAQPPILAWNANGQEDQRAFMLLLPGTESGRTQLARMGSLDWQMVLGTAKLLLQCLPEAPAPLPAWAAVAARLVRELQALPPRLRYDAVSSCSAAADTTGVRPVELCFQGSSFGDLNLGNLRLLWQPVQRQLSCLAPERAGQLALAHWPLSGDGSLQPNLKLPVGKGEGAQQRTQWAALADTDRSLLLGLLDALPGAAAQVDAALLPPNWRTEQLVQQAHELHRQARRLQGRLSAFATARRLLRRPAAAAD